MSAVTPFEALFYFAADNVDEVNREHESWMERITDGLLPLLARRVTVIAVEYMIGHGDYVWLVDHGDQYHGQIFRRESWMVRAMG